MNIANSVNGVLPASDEFWCFPALAQYRTQYVILDRCEAVEFEQFDCLEFVTQLSSLRVADHFDSLIAARGMFEFIYQFEPALEVLRAKPLPFDVTRTVSIRDHCEGVAYV